MPPTSAQSLHTSLTKLSISSSSKTSPKPGKAEPVDSWEEAADGDDNDEQPDSGTATPVRPVSSSDYPQAPPPTPSSPSFSTGKTVPGTQHQTFPPHGLHESAGMAAGRRERPQGRRDQGEQRPEKTTAVASRMIAAGLGQQAPKRTEEQRAYDRAMKAQEKKKLEQAREAEARKRREGEEAKRAIWDD